MGELTDPHGHDYVPAPLAIRAMRDNGYRNTAYAIAELIDNSVQAEARTIELLCAEEAALRNHNKTKQVRHIAVLDDGEGMDAETLRIALQFGNGSRLEEGKKRGIGRFGMGLPASSISQCTRVDVWSWQDGPESALRTYLDVEDVCAGRQQAIPEPDPLPIPDLWRDSCHALGKSGTLVVWSNLDRTLWRTAASVIGNTEFYVGRMYRRFIADGGVRIRMAAFDVTGPRVATQDDWARVNDPLYLTAHTSCPEPYADRPMFRQWNETQVEQIRFRGEVHSVSVRYAYAEEAARAGAQAGARPHGKHAMRNVGVSLMRAGRELELEQTLVVSGEPRERWWGVEIEFEPGLDDLFGVTNNKQTARNFSDIARLVRDDRDLDDLGEEHRTGQRSLLEEEENPRVPLHTLLTSVKNNVQVLRRLIEAQHRGQNQDVREQRHQAAETATLKTRERQERGHVGGSDAGESKPDDQRMWEIEQGLIAWGAAAGTAHELAASTILNRGKFIITEAAMDLSAFFSVAPRGGAVVLTLNTGHPAYKHLVDALEVDDGTASDASLRQRLATASNSLRLLLMAWARYEDELPDGPRKQAAQDARADWGRMARDFLTVE